MYVGETHESNILIKALWKWGGTNRRRVATKKTKKHPCVIFC